MTALPEGRLRRRPNVRLPGMTFRFSNDQLIECESGIAAYSTANHFVMNADLQSPDERLPTRMYFNSDGTPADARTEYYLRYDMANLLTFLHGRIYRKPFLPETASFDWSDEAAAIARFNEMEPVYHGSPNERSFSQSDEDRRDSAASWNRFIALGRKPRARRPIMELPQSAWRVLVRRRLALIFEISASDPLLHEMAGYFSRDEGWLDWESDPRFASLLQRTNEPLIAGVLNVVFDSAIRRAADRERDRVFGGRREETLKCARSEYRFDFPPGNRKGTRALLATELLLVVARVELHQRAAGRDLPKHCAAAVYEARHYLVAPRSLASRPMTQEIVARRFKVSRRQLQHARAEILRPDYGDRVLQMAVDAKLPHL